MYIDTFPSLSLSLSSSIYTSSIQKVTRIIYFLGFKVISIRDYLLQNIDLLCYDAFFLLPSSALQSYEELAKG